MSIDKTFLDETGLQTYDGKIKEYIGAINPEQLGIGYGTCSTEGLITSKVVSLENYELKDNGIVAVKFVNLVPANATLNINSKGAKSIYYKDAAITAGVIGAGDTATFVYSDNKYHVISIDVTGGSGSGGHTIVDYTGLTMPSRSKLQFIGGVTEDDGSNDTTKVYLWNAWVYITTSSPDLYEETITVTKNGSTVGTTAFSAQGEAVFLVHEPGTYTFSCTIEQ